MGQTSIPKYGVRRMNSLVFGERLHTSERIKCEFRPSQQEFLWHSNCTSINRSKAGKRCTHRRCNPGFHVFLPQARLFRRPLTGHCASGRSLPRRRPRTFNTPPELSSEFRGRRKLPSAMPSSCRSPQESSFWRSPQESSFWRSQNLRISLSHQLYPPGKAPRSSTRGIAQAMRPDKLPCKCFSCYGLALRV